MRKKSNIKHLLVVRLSAMGDVAMVPHSIRALRQSYPDMKITVLTKALFAPLFEGLDVDILPIDLRGRHNGFWGVKRLADDIVALGVDAVADLHKVLRIRLLSKFLWLRGVPVKHIKKGRVSKWMRMDGGCRKVTKALKHTVIRYCDVFRSLGLEIDDPTPATKVIRENPMPFEKGSERWIGIAPFSVHKGKIYPTHLVRIVVAELTKRYDRVFIHSGPGSELAFAEELEQSNDRVIAVFSKVKLKGEIELIANLDCIISMDSFAMHVAALVGTPTVSIWGATHPSLGFSGYLTDPDGYVQLDDLPCRPCSTYGNKLCRFGDYHCLNDIEPLDIVNRVETMINKS